MSATTPGTRSSPRAPAPHGVFDVTSTVLKSQAAPYRAGLATSWSRLEAKTSAAVMPATPRTAATKPVRTGTRVRPAPDSKAIRIPLVNDGRDP